MKKLISIFAALVMIFTVTANAQTVQKSTLFENTYVTLSGGAISTTHPGDAPFFWEGAETLVKGLRPFAGLEVGKYITPAFGLSLEALAMYNTTGSDTFVDQTNLIANMKFNLSNWFGGYKGEPRVFEIVAVPGLGWNYDWGNVTHAYRNALTYNAGLEFNFNLGAKKAWQINIKPSVVWYEYNKQFTPRVENMQGKLQIGLTYKFGSRKKNSHNFVYCPYSVTQADYDALKADYEKLLAKAPEVKEVVKEVVVEKEVVKVEKEYVIPSTVVPFQIGSATISKSELKKLQDYLETLPEGVTVSIVGSADTQTGSKGRNEYLAEERMNAVKAVVEGNSKVKCIIGTTGLDVNPVPADSRVAVIKVATK